MSSIYIDATARRLRQRAEGHTRTGTDGPAPHSEPERSVLAEDEVGGYDAVVIGAAAYPFHWLKAATRFVKRHREELRRRPVWLFSSGPLGTDLVDEDGRDILESTRPREFAELHDLISPREERVFFGAWDPEAPPVGLGERLVRRMPAARDAIPAGDFRDWPAIEAWAADIATELLAAETAGAPRAAR
jgi:menaquinone-dependent protoporphyrinogen oxidase